MINISIIYTYNWIIIKIVKKLFPRSCNIKLGKKLFLFQKQEDEIEIKFFSFQISLIKFFSN